MLPLIAAIISGMLRSKGKSKADRGAFHRRRRSAGGEMGEYLPYSGEHSIQEVVVAVHFPAEFPPEVVERSYHAAEADFEGEFSQFNAIHRHLHNVKVNISTQRILSPQVPSQPVFVGFEFLKLKPDAKPARVLRFHENVLSLHFLEYESWDMTLEITLKYLKTVLSLLTLTENPVVAFSLQYVDRYTYDGPQNESRAEMLLQENSAYISTRCFDSKSLWHCNSGWFESFESGPILHQLNIGSGLIDQVSTITINHNATCQLEISRQSVGAIFQPDARGKNDIKSSFDLLHQRNKEIIKDIILPDMLAKIGMEI